MMSCRGLPTSLRIRCAHAHETSRVVKPPHFLLVVKLIHHIFIGCEIKKYHYYNQSDEPTKFPPVPFRKKKKKVGRAMVRVQYDCSHHFK